MTSSQTELDIVAKFSLHFPTAYRSLLKALIAKNAERPLPNDVAEQLLPSEPGRSRPRRSGRARGGLFGAALTEEGVALVAQLVDFLQPHVGEKGLFRISGSAQRQDLLRSQLNRSETVDFARAGITCHDAASVLKEYLNELPEPLLSAAHIAFYHEEVCKWAEGLSAAQSGGYEKRKVDLIRLLFLCLSHANRSLLQLLLGLLASVAAASQSSLMSPESLAMAFAPAFFRLNTASLKAAKDELQPAITTLAFLIRYQTALFRVPRELRKSVYVELTQRRNRLLARQPNSASDLKGRRGDGVELCPSTIATCDRVKSFEDSFLINTETEMAKHMAHIQSMPESKHKQKLLKAIREEQRVKLGLSPSLSRAVGRKPLRPSQANSPALSFASVSTTFHNSPSALPRPPRPKSLDQILQEEEEEETSVGLSWRSTDSLTSEDWVDHHPGAQVPLAASTFLAVPGGEENSGELWLGDPDLVAALEAFSLDSSSGDEETPSVPKGQSTYRPAQGNDNSLWITPL